jgi:eukaryotic-like serine/threonine-protein kinase
VEDRSQLLGGRYRLERLLGAGGMATVHLAVDTTLQVQRAIKMLNRNYATSPMVRERFVTEAHAQARLRHPNILMVHDVQLTDAGVYMVMDVAENGSLSLRVKERGPLSPAEASEAAITLLGALELAHKFNVVHRDIKPENVLVDATGVLKLADFGIARVVERNMNMTRTGMTMGTWAYMPPEQRNSAKSVDGRADLYALGASIYYLVTAKEPFDLHNTESYDEAFAGFPEPLAQIVMKATRFNPTDRYVDADDMRKALLALRGKLGTSPVFAGPQPTGAPNPFASTLVPGQVDSQATLAPIGPHSPTIHTVQAPVMSALPTLGGDATVAPAGLVSFGREETLIKREIEPVIAPRAARRGWLGVAIAAATVVAAVAIGRSVQEPPIVDEAPKIPALTEPVEAAVAAEPPPPETEATPIAADVKPRPVKIVPAPSTAPESTPAPTKPIVVTGATSTVPPESGANTQPYIVRSVPYGAAVFVDGASVGQAGARRLLPEGKHKVRMVLTVDGVEKEKAFDLDVKAKVENYYCWNFNTDSQC